MSALLGLAAAVAFGISDFVAGVGARRLHFLWVTLLGQSASAAVIWIALIWVHGAGPTPQAALWGACSGIGSAVGTLALYRGYGRGEMAVAGPLSAIGAAALPAVIGIALGERLDGLQLAGIVLALPAIWLMAASGGSAGRRLRGGVVDGLVSGLGFGGLFTMLKLAGGSSGLWPVALGQAVAVLLLIIAVAVRRPAATSTPRASGQWFAVIAGVLGITATLLYFAAAQSGLLSIAAVLTSLYPGITVALAAAVLHERPALTQQAGMLLGAVSITAIVLA